MDKKVVLTKTEKFVRHTLEHDSTGHDWWHTYRVWRTALQIGEEEGVNLYVVQLAALLHDVADYKFHGGDETLGPKVAREWLEKLEVDEDSIAHVCQIIAKMSFRGAEVDTPMPSREGLVVQDADRLDAIGAVGIGRAFAFGGHRGQAMYDPGIEPIRHTSFEEYKKRASPTINHFYEKLLLLKDRMNTDTARQLAEERHRFMKAFLQQFFAEWEGER